MKIRCVQCGREFELSQNEIDFYYSKGLDLPKRCKSCRDKNSGKYIVTYSENHNINLFFFAVFLNKVRIFDKTSSEIAIVESPTIFLLMFVISFM